MFSYECDIGSIVDILSSINLFLSQHYPLFSMKTIYRNQNRPPTVLRNMQFFQIPSEHREQKRSFTVIAKVKVHSVPRWEYNNNVP